MFAKKVIQDVEYVMSLLKLELQQKLEDQGHGRRETSKLISTIEPEVKAVATTIIGKMWIEDYGIYINKGVSASRIPYGGPKTGKKVSKYIQGLIRHFRLKAGLSFSEAKRAAFATANKQKRTGMPTPGSFRYSKDGTRLGFIDSTLENYEKKTREILERQVGESIELTFTDILTKFAKNI